MTWHHQLACMGAKLNSRGRGFKITFRASPEPLRRFSKVAFDGRPIFGESSRGNTIRGNRTESLWEGNLPLRGSLRGPLKTLWKISENFWKPLKISENLWKPLKTSTNLWISLETSESLSKPLEASENPLRTLPRRDPLKDPLRGRFPSQRLWVQLPLLCCPLNSLRDIYWVLVLGEEVGHTKGGRATTRFLARCLEGSLTASPSWKGS